MSDLDALSDEQLAARASDALQREGCMGALYARHHARVLAWCVRLSGDQHEALDVTQDVFMRAESALHTFRRDSRFTTWLYVIARRTAIDALRRRHAAMLRIQTLYDEPTDSPPSPEKLAQDDDLARRLNADLKKLLAPDEAQVIYMHFSLGMTLPRITRTLGLTNASGAKAPFVAAMRKLRRHYKPAGMSMEDRL